MAYDLIILGLGPAGMAATIYARRYNLSTITFGKNIGGLMAEAWAIENYPGFESISGQELANKIFHQVQKLKAEIVMKEIANIEKNGNSFSVQTNDNKSFEAKSIIIALGTEKRKLNIKGEDEFLGRGVSYCSVCDAPFFANKTVAVIGGRDSAAHAALLLAEKCKKVFIVYRREELRAKPFLIEKLKQNKKIEIIYNALPKEIKGSGKVSSLVIEKKGKNEELALEGVFVEIGSVPVTSLAKRLKVNLDKDGYIAVNDKMETNIAGIYAAGDITASPLRQVITAAAQGAIAASSAYDFLKMKKE